MTPRDPQDAAKHTPGPWHSRRAKHTNDSAFDYGIVAAIDGKEYCIAEAFGRVAESVWPNVEANARLIAAAPDLLAACKTMLRKLEACARLHGNGDEVIADMTEPFRAAIRKAEGAA